METYFLHLSMKTSNLFLFANNLNVFFFSFAFMTYMLDTFDIFFLGIHNYLQMSFFLIKAAFLYLLIFFHNLNYLFIYLFGCTESQLRHVGSLVAACGIFS